MNFEEFKILHSEVVMCCQCLENDIKWIYSYMKKGDPLQNFDDLEKKTFGQIVRELRKLDYSDDKPYISKSDYDFLEKLADKRNFGVTNVMLTFCMSPTIFHQMNIIVYIAN